MVKNLCNVLFLISKLSQKLKGKLSKLTISQFLKETVSGIFDHAFYRAIVIKLSQLMETVRIQSCISVHIKILKPESQGALKRKI